MLYQAIRIRGRNVNGKYTLPKYPFLQQISQAQTRV